MGMNARAWDGKWNGGKVLGYDLVEIPDSNRKRKEQLLTINNKEAELVRHIFELYYNGKGYKNPCKLDPTKEGYHTKKGNYFSVVSIKDIVTNPLYSGMIRYDPKKEIGQAGEDNPDPILVPESWTNHQQRIVWKGSRADKVKRW